MHASAERAERGRRIEELGTDLGIGCIIRGMRGMRGMPPVLGKFKEISMEESKNSRTAQE